MPLPSRAAPALLVALLTAALTACSAGTPPSATPTAPASVRAPIDVGHGSVEDVVEALAQQGLPCEGPVAGDPGAYEQLTTCTVEGTPVTLVHFFSEEQAAAYERTQRREGVPGVYSETWGARVGDAELARRLSAAIADTTSG